MHTILMINSRITQQLDIINPLGLSHHWQSNMVQDTPFSVLNVRMCDT